MVLAKIAVSLVLMGTLNMALADSAPPPPQSGQSQPGQSATGQRPKSNLLVGSITAIGDQSLTVQPDSGPVTTVTVSETAHIMRTAPGAKTVAGATPIAFADLAVGDRVLVALHQVADDEAPTATTVIDMKQADIAQKREAEQADWQRRGTGGIVKTVDPADSSLTIAIGNQAVTVHATPKTAIRRYSADSIKFSNTRAATLDQIRPGDQLRVRGDRSTDGKDIQAEEIVAGSFRNISGTIVTVNPAANTATVMDLATKKPLIVHITADTQMHKLPPEMAQALAVRFKHDTSGGTKGKQQQTDLPAAAPNESAQLEQGSAARREGHARNLSEILQSAPAIQLSDLHKGDAVMIVSSQGESDAVTAFTLLAGVEPILAASPSSSQNMFSASWNLGGAQGGQSAEGAPSTDK